MVTKRRRRSQLARASAQRRSERLALRAQRRRWTQRIVGALLAVAAVVALVVWIAVHDDGAASALPTLSTSLIEVAP